MSIRITPAAAGAVLAALSQRGRGIGVRLCMSMSGCSGLSYWLEFADELQDQEMTFDLDGVRVVIPTSHLMFVEGLEIDYLRKENEEGFVINGPASCKDECACPDDAAPC